MSKWISPKIPKCNIENNLTVLRIQYKNGMVTVTMPYWSQKEIVEEINKHSKQDGFEGYRIYHTDSM